MKKKNCRMTAQEKVMHEEAVKLRKMTDEQLYEAYHNSTLQGYLKGMEEQKQTDLLLIKNTKGIGSVTYERLQKAIEDSIIE